MTVATKHILGGTGAFFVAVQDCYERWDPSTPPGLQLPSADDLPPDVDEIDRSPLFKAPTFRRYQWEERYSAASYLDLLRSYSGHRHLGPKRRERLLACIGDLIEHDHGGQVVKRYMNEMRIALRRAVGRCAESVGPERCQATSR